MISGSLPGMPTPTIFPSKDKNRPQYLTSNRTVKKAMHGKNSTVFSKSTSAGEILLTLGMVRTEEYCCLER